jgi:hypothetical protein
LKAAGQLVLHATKQTQMKYTTNFVLKSTQLIVSIGLMAFFSGCDTAPTGCQKCIDNKPPPTAFSQQVNSLNHYIPLADAVGMVSRFAANPDIMLSPEMRGRNIIPQHETFNLKLIDSLICQKKAVAFRIYNAKTPDGKLHMVLVGVDGDGQDIIQSNISNPTGASVFTAEDHSILVGEAGQRWP